MEEIRHHHRRHRRARPAPIVAILGCVAFLAAIVVGGDKLYRFVKIPQTVQAQVVFTRDFVAVKNTGSSRWEDTTAILNGRYRYTNAALWPGWSANIPYTNFVLNGERFKKGSEKPNQLFLQPKGSKGIVVRAPANY
jgi:hypothetical protein